MSDLLQPYTPARQLRSASDAGTFFIPCANTKTFDERSFPYTGSSVWNKLPQTLRHSDSASSFKAALKTHLLNNYFWTVFQSRAYNSTVDAPVYVCVCVCVCVYACMRACACLRAHTCVCVWCRLLVICYCRFLPEVSQSGFVKLCTLFHYLVQPYVIPLFGTTMRYSSVWCNRTLFLYFIQPYVIPPFHKTVRYSSIS